MRIQSGEKIAGQPALAIRKLMQHGRSCGPITSGNPLETIVEVLDVDLSTAKQVYQDLCTEGYIEPVPDMEDHWFTTIKGNALAQASARKPIKRQTADRQLELLLGRVKQINAGDYAYRVKQVIVFGSYLSDAPTLGDVDLSLVLENRYQDSSAQKIGLETRITAAIDAGRQFRNAMEMLMWPAQEVLLLLKHRSSALSLHIESRERVLERHIPSKILFDADALSGGGVPKSAGSI